MRGINNSFYWPHAPLYPYLDKKLPATHSFRSFLCAILHVGSCLSCFIFVKLLSALEKLIVATSSSGWLCLCSRIEHNERFRLSLMLGSHVRSAFVFLKSPCLPPTSCSGTGCLTTLFIRRALVPHLAKIRCVCEAGSSAQLFFYAFVYSSLLLMNGKILLNEIESSSSRKSRVDSSRFLLTHEGLEKEKEREKRFASPRHQTFVEGKQ